MASAACIKIAGVPVEFSVATIFWQMMALFPIPVTITLPLADRIRRTHFIKLSFTERASPATAKASLLMVFNAIFFSD